MGATVYEGHDAAHVASATVVITSSAVSAHNPEVVEARARKIPVIQRAEMLAELMRLKYGIAVAGMHWQNDNHIYGCVRAFPRGGLDPTVIVGGRVDALGSNAKLGTTQYLVAEADESDRSFLKLSPILAVVTNLDREHMDCYHDMEDVEHATCFFPSWTRYRSTVLLRLVSTMRHWRQSCLALIAVSSLMELQRKLITDSRVLSGKGRRPSLVSY